MLRILLLLFFATSFAIAQHTDSLLYKLAKTNDPKSKVDLYNSLAGNYWHSDTEKATLYADSAYQLAYKIEDYLKGRVKAIANKGVGIYMSGNYLKAIEYYSRALKLGNDNNIDTNEIFRNYLAALKKTGNFTKLLKQVDSVFDKNDVDSNYKQQLIYTKIRVLITLGDAIQSRELLNYLEETKNKAIPYSSLLVQKAGLENLTGQYNTALAYLNNALVIEKENGDSLNIANIFNEIGKTYILLGQYDKALLSTIESLEIYKNANYSHGIARNKYQLGYLYSEMGKNDLAIDNFYEALKVFEKQFNKKEMAETYCELAFIYSKQDMPKAMELLQRSLSLSEENGDKFTESTAYNYMGTFYTFSKKYDSALIAYNMALKLGDELGYYNVAAEFNIGNVYEQLGDYEKALELYQKTYPIEINRGNMLGAAISEYSLGSLYTKMKKYKEAGQFLEMALTKLNKLEADGYLLECLAYTVKYYEEINDPENALSYYKKYANLKDVVYNREKDVHIAEIEARYGIQKKEEKIKLLRLENRNRIQSAELQEKTISNQWILIALISSGIIGATILLIVTYRLLGIKSKANEDLKVLNKEISEQSDVITAQSEELKEANEEIISLNDGLEEKVSRRTEELKSAHKELDTFFYHASHDFRRPLTTFLGLAEIANTILIDPKALELFEKVSETAGSLDRMVSKLKAISIIGFDNIVYTNIDFNEVIGQLLIKHKKLIIERNVTVNIDLTIKKYRSSVDLFEIILDNILENAILYSRLDIDAFVNIEIREENDQLILQVSDNGQGIESELLDMIFNMYYRANESSQGNGLGLYIAKKAAGKLNGVIEFKTEYGEGSTFTVMLPESV
jgi:signal transduction histidine kinase/lipopolysaccharide biosynthesis regulator YciM